MTKAKLNIFCAWGDGPDVGINIIYADGKLVPLDFSAAEARQLSVELLSAAAKAEQIQKSYEDYVQM